MRLFRVLNVRAYRAVIDQGGTSFSFFWRRWGCRLSSASRSESFAPSLPPFVLFCLHTAASCAPLLPSLPLLPLLSPAIYRFTFMSIELKNRLRDKMLEFKDDYNLSDIFYGSFYRQQGYKSSISAADTVYSISALLEIGSRDEVTEQPWQRNFNLAYDALSGYVARRYRQYRIHTRGLICCLFPAAPMRHCRA